jgi:hypothetical protein
MARKVAGKQRQPSAFFRVVQEGSKEGKKDKKEQIVLFALFVLLALFASFFAAPTFSITRSQRQPSLLSVWAIFPFAVTINRK